MMSRSLLNTVALVLMLFTVYSHAYAQTVSLSEEDDDEKPLYPFLSYHIDEQATLSITNILKQLPLDDFWQHHRESPINFGFLGKPVWVKIDFHNIHNDVIDRVVVIHLPTIDHIEFYRLNNNLIVDHFRAGNEEPVTNRRINHRNFIYPLKMAPNETATLLIRADESGSLQLPISVWKTLSYWEEEQFELIKYSLILGVFAALALYNLFLYLSVRNAAQGYYVLYIAGIFCIMSSQVGFGSQFFWSKFPEISSFIIQIFVNLSVVFACLFCIKILSLKKNDWRYKVNMAFILVSVTMLPCIAIIPLHYHLLITVALAVMNGIANFIIGISLWRNNKLSTRLFTVGWMMMLFGIILYGGSKLGLISPGVVVDNAVWIGASLEGLFLSFSLGSRINQLQAERIMLTRQNHENELIRLELEKKSVEIETLNKAQTDFLATFSHEVRTPINGILGMMSLMKDTPLTEEQDEYVEAARISGEMLSHLLTSVLDLTKIEANKMQLELVETNLYTLARGCTHMFLMLANEKGLGLSCEIAPEVPEFVWVDPTRLKQILINFLSNAVKFTEKGHVKLTIALNGHSHKKNTITGLHINISDTGIGMSESQQQQLFSAFYQADKSTTRKYGGTGLGLAITKRLVDLMDGEVGVKSEENRGTEFWFNLEVEVANNSNAIQPHVKSRANATDSFQPGSLKLRVLAAEDNKVNRLLLGKYLEKMGCQHDIRENGKEAYDAYCQEPDGYDLIILDYEMPEMNGLETAKYIRAFEKENQLPETGLVSLSANILPETRQALADSGVNEMINKPIDFNKLQLTLKRFIPS